MPEIFVIPSPAPPKPKWQKRKFEPDCCEVNAAAEESLWFSLNLVLDAKEGGRRGRSR
jgi:hypothetical protein